MIKIYSNPNKVYKTFFLDILRGLAAFYVLAGHARWLLWEGYAAGYKTHAELYSFVEKIQVWAFTLFAFGHEAVMLFFVLSGFVIHYSSYNGYIKSGGFSVFQYLGKRIKRIYPPFLFAIALTFVLDSIGISKGYTIYHGATAFPIINESFYSDLSWQTLMANLCMLQRIITPVWGSNGPLWSLMYEWWFYILYIPVFFINRRAPLITLFLIGGVFMMSSLQPLQQYKGVSVIQYFFAWYLGVVAADWYMGRFTGNSTKINLLVYIGIVFITATILRGYSSMMDYYIAAFFVLIMYLSIHFYARLHLLHVLQPLSDFSYTLYVIHMPILVLLSGWLQQRLGGDLPMHFGYVYVSLVICLLFAWGAHFLVEKPFTRKR